MENAVPFTPVTEPAAVPPDFPDRSTGLSGHLHLICAIDSRGCPALREQSFAAPMHLTKPYLDSGALIVNAVNQTAGLISGDQIQWSIRVEKGARMVLTSPSASRAHRMLLGRAVQQQAFHVERDSFLEVWPELFIPHAGTSYVQKTRIDLEENASLFFFETLAPGRAASGEIFRFDLLDWETEIFLKGKKVVREKYRLTHSNGSFRAILRKFEQPYYASVFVFDAAVAKAGSCWEQIRALHHENLWVACSQIAEAGWAIRVLASESPALRLALSKVREILHAASGRPQPDPRKL
jgi:urease accessory protein